MTPFEEFKIWLRQGAAFERVFAGIAAMIAVGLIAWVAVPTSDSTSGGGAPLAAGPTTESTATTLAGAAPATDGTSPTAAGQVANGPSGSSGAGSTGGGTVRAAGQSTGAAASTCPEGSTDQGVTDTTVSIAVILLDVAGGNSVLGVPGPDEQKRENQAVIDALNAQGGLLCRKVVPKYYTDNPLDANSEHGLCLDITASKPFAAMGGLYQPQNSSCLPQNKIPSFLQTQRPTSEMKKFWPYLFDFYADSETMLRAYAYGANEAGFFTGMKKLGVVIFDCFPEYWPQLQGALDRLGIPGDKIETFNYGCPPGGIVEPPSTVAQGVLQFQQHGVDRVMSAGPNLASFTSQAQGQAYHPKYAVSDLDTTMTLSPSTGFRPDATNFEGALDIANSQYGATTTPGATFSPETDKCDAMLKGKADWMSRDGDGYAGGVCNQWNMLVQGVTHAGTLVRTQIAVGLGKVGEFAQPFPGAPARWNDPAHTFAGPYWRPIRYQGDCNCWKLIRAAWSDKLA